MRDELVHVLDGMTPAEKADFLADLLILAEYIAKEKAAASAADLESVRALPPTFARN